MHDRFSMYIQEIDEIAIEKWILRSRHIIFIKCCVFLQILFFSIQIRYLLSLYKNNWILIKKDILRYFTVCFVFYWCKSNVVLIQQQGTIMKLAFFTHFILIPVKVYIMKSTIAMLPYWLKVSIFRITFLLFLLICKSTIESLTIVWLVFVSY